MNCPKCGELMELQGSCVDDILRDYYNCLSCNIHWSYGSDFGWIKEGEAERPNCYFSPWQRSRSSYCLHCFLFKECNEKREAMRKKDPADRIRELKKEISMTLNAGEELKMWKEIEFLEQVIKEGYGSPSKPKQKASIKETGNPRIREMINALERGKA